MNSRPLITDSGRPLLNEKNPNFQIPGPCSVRALAGPAGIDERWTAPLKNRIASSLPGFDASTIDGLVRRTLAVASPTVEPARSG